MRCTCPQKGVPGLWRVLPSAWTSFQGLVTAERMRFHAVPRRSALDTENEAIVQEALADLIKEASATVVRPFFYRNRWLWRATSTEISVIVLKTLCCFMAKFMQN